MLILLSLSCQVLAQLIITEVMYNPQGSEHENEFIEVYNPGPDSIDIDGWCLSDGTGIDTLGHILVAAGIAPGQFAVVLDPSYSLDGGQYEELIPDGTPLYSISTDNTFGSGGLSNGGESVIIYSPDSSVYLDLSWNESTLDGHSLERVFLNPDYAESWLQSLAVHGTPGSTNSVTPPDINLQIDSLVLDVRYLEPYMPVGGTLYLTNTGLKTIASTWIRIYSQSEPLHFDEVQELTHENFRILNLEPQASISSRVVLPPGKPGINLHRLCIETAGDEISSDDDIQIEIQIPYPTDCLVVNEILFSPTAEQGGEFVELMNIWNHPVSLNGWTFADAGETRHPVTSETKLVLPGDLLVLCSNAEVQSYFLLDPRHSLVMPAMPALNSSSDSIRLYDATGSPIQRLLYRGSWGQTGRSLERRHPFHTSAYPPNWTASTHPDGGTPGKANSTLLAEYSIRIMNGLDILVVGDSQLQLTANVQNTGLETIEEIHLSLESPAFAADHAFLTTTLASWDSLTHIFALEDLLPGWHPMTLTANVPTRVYIDTTVYFGIPYEQNVITINEIHSRPDEDQVEFLEFVNTGGFSIVLANWVLIDRAGTQGLLPTPQEHLAPGAFLVLSGNIAGLDLLPSDSLMILEVEPWPSLNASGDSIYLRDAGGRIHLQHGYSSAQGGATGISLERKALWIPAVVDSNWSSCISAAGITPGVPNSIELHDSYRSNLSLTAFNWLDSLSRLDTDLHFHTQIINRSHSPVAEARLRLELTQQESLITNVLSSSFTLDPGDTLVVDLSIQSGTSGWIEAGVVIVSSQDHYNGDDSLSMPLYIPFEESPMQLTEIMPLPLNGDPEWLEIHNSSLEPVLLHGWQIQDQSMRSLTVDSALILAAGAYTVLASAEGVSYCDPGAPYIHSPDFPTLNNSGDRIYLIDPAGIIRDSLAYDIQDHPPGRSLERINPDRSGTDPLNWGIHVGSAGHSAGCVNSIHFGTGDHPLIFQLGPNPFSPDGDGFEDILEIDFNLPWPTARLNIQIYDLAGRPVHRLADQLPVAHRGRIQWDGSWQYGEVARVGLYILHITVESIQGEFHESLHKAYVARRF